MPYPLAVISPSFGIKSETFIHRHMIGLLPGKTAIVVHNNEDTDATFPHLPNLIIHPSRKDWRWFCNGFLFASGWSNLSPVQRRVLNFLKEHGTKIILSEYLDYSLKWIDVARKQGILFFAHAHGYDVSKTLRDPAMRRQYLRLDEADGIITMSEVSRQRLIELGLNSHKIHVIPYGIDVQDQCPKHETKDVVYCLAVGRMVGKKAPLNTLKAFQQAFIHNSKLRLDYIGEGELYPEAVQFVRHYTLEPFVKLHGAQPNSVVQKYMKNADIFIQHSITDPETGDEEGLPVAILEAMSGGLPVVATRHAGIPEAVLEDQTGYLVDEGDVDGMAHYLIKLADDFVLRDRLGYNGWKRAQGFFTWNRERSLLLELFKLNETTNLTDH